MTSYPVFLPSPSASDKWKSPSLSTFFLEVPFNQWKPKIFAMDQQSSDMSEFTSGLANIATSRGAVGAFATSILRYLKSPEGVRMIEEARTILQLRKSAQTRGHAEYLYTNTVTHSDFLRRTQLEKLPSGTHDVEDELAGSTYVSVPSKRSHLDTMATVDGVEPASSRKKGPPSSDPSTPASHNGLGGEKSEIGNGGPLDYRSVCHIDVF